MFMDKYNLHNHTTYSDGELSPAEVVAFNKQHGFNVIAITDHNSVDGISEAIEEGKKLGVTVIAGVELDTGKYDILGLFINHNDSHLREILSESAALEDLILEHRIKMLKARGIGITKEMIAKFTKARMVSINKLSKALVHYGLFNNLVDAKRVVKSVPIQTVIQKTRQKGYARDEEMVIKLIAKHGGIPVFAHPFSYKKMRLPYLTLPRTIRRLQRQGVKGLEVQHPNNSKFQEGYLNLLARMFSLQKFGGMDLHGGEPKKLEKWLKTRQRKDILGSIKRLSR